MPRTDFSSRVLSAVRRIPAGRVATYGDIAAAAGRPLASRAVGNVMRTCEDLSVPCHRVIGSDGSMRGYAGGVERKARLLAHEGALQPALF